ncbi:hypothetical protein [Mucilaginibacter paludis]|uniref:Uncharacterized protein n=1 Tax=Mucilaginibacter paludis DSM 18603 TaxID=714943 RepID=H1YEQ1_9SPHI|nr:hypothetical protein [Mucilaginibacter paludis]EHQ30811.1 hypothetical protein Mucpa_6762 [Mucilaginibacter paludis DSM 18603]
MKRESIIYYIALLMVLVIASSCVKVEPKFNSNNLTVTFNNAGSNYVIGNKTVNGKDSLNFSYSGTCTTPITYVTLTKNDTEVGRDSIKTGDRMSFTNLVKKLVADTIPGSYIYRVVARDKSNIYLGSSNNIIITVNSDMTFITNNRVSVPDTTAKTNKAYFNIATQTAYSYSDITAGNNSNVIDFGYFWDPTIASGTTVKGHTIYNLNLSPIPSAITMYNTSTFTKNATQFKVVTSPITWTSLNSGATLKALGATTFKTASANSVTGLAAGSVFLFKTAAGKYGAINVTYVSAASAYATTYMNFDLKIAN